MWRSEGKNWSRRTLTEVTEILFVGPALDDAELLDRHTAFLQQCLALIFVQIQVSSVHDSSLHELVSHEKISNGIIEMRLVHMVSTERQILCEILERISEVIMPIQLFGFSWCRENLNRTVFRQSSFVSRLDSVRLRRHHQCEPLSMHDCNVNRRSV